MEKVTKSGQIAKSMEYTPFWGVSEDLIDKRKWELVFFLSPVCDGICAHCWSAETYLGKTVTLPWHYNFWKSINPSRVREIRLTGGEPFLFRQIGGVVDIIRSSLGTEIPIRILTSGRHFISFKDGQEGVEETILNLQARGVVKDNVEIQLSADEHHACSVFRQLKRVKKRKSYSLDELARMNELGLEYLGRMASNFLNACDQLSSGDSGFIGGKLKVHAEQGRLAFHRKVVFPWLDDVMWNEKVIASEGLVEAGSAKKLSNTFKLKPNDQISLFFMPGAKFYPKPISRLSQEYKNTEKRNLVYLDSSDDNEGVSIIGWWNIVNRVFCGGTTSEAVKKLLS